MTQPLCFEFDHHESSAITLNIRPKNESIIPKRRNGLLDDNSIIHAG